MTCLTMAVIPYKTTGNDIKEKKLTLPLIYALNNADKATRKKLIYIIKSENKNTEKVQEVIAVVKAIRGISMPIKKCWPIVTKL